MALGAKKVGKEKNMDIDSFKNMSFENNTMKSLKRELGNIKRTNLIKMGDAIT